MSHIYIAKVELNVRCEDLIDYLKCKFPHEEFIIKALRSYIFYQDRKKKHKL